MATAEIEALTPVGEREKLLQPYGFSSLTDDPRLKALTDFVAKLCDAPVALVSLVGDERQSFLARTGLEARHTSRETSFCAHAMEGMATMVVPDATLDPRFRENPLVTGEPHIRFYAGAPLHTAGGRPLGALCVIDNRPREALTPLQEQGLAALAQAVMALFEAQRARISFEEETTQARGERDDREQRFRVLADAMPQMVWSTLPDGFHDYYNARWYEFTGVPEGSTDGEGWNGMFHPDDQERAWTLWRHCLATGEPYEIEYRLRDHHGDYRWVLGRALPMRDANDRIIRWFGTCTDIHDQRMAMEHRELISHELSHRIKNIFSVINGLIGLSSREEAGSGAFAEKLRERVMALGKAHDFVRPHSEASRPAARQTSLRGMLDELLSAYQNEGRDRVQIEGEDIAIDDRSATPFALLFHELATNAAKYGALSSPDGQVRVSIRGEEPQVVIDWVETGGPKPQPSDHVGFGSRLIAMSAERQLGGTITREWAPSGLKLRVTLPSSSMSRD